MWLWRQREQYFCIVEVVAIIAKNSNEEVMTLLLDRRGEEVQITEEVIKTAAEYSGNGREMMTLLLDRRGAEIPRSAVSRILRASTWRDL